MGKAELAQRREFCSFYRKSWGVEDAQELGKGSFSSVALLLQQSPAAIPSQGLHILWQSVEIIHLNYAGKGEKKHLSLPYFSFFS